MEQWNEIFKGTIPKGAYECKLINGENCGLVILLNNKSYAVTIDFGVTICLRMFDEGALLMEWPPFYEAKRTNGFSNIIYEICDGSLLETVKSLSSNLYEDGELHHYVVVTENYVIEIISKWEPDISVLEI